MTEGKKNCKTFIFLVEIFSDFVINILFPDYTDQLHNEILGYSRKANYDHVVYWKQGSLDLEKKISKKAHFSNGFLCSLLRTPINFPLEIFSDFVINILFPDYTD